jgi:dipeptidyl aminopeptidase/acylaminoacyl peptidase
LTERELSFAASPCDWSLDGRFLLYTDLGEDDALHLWVLPRDGEAYRLFSGISAEAQGQFSPDGRWVAYSSNESGRWQVCIAPFPGREGKCQVSTHGGQQPRWRRDGKELFFLARDQKLMSVSVKADSTFEFSAPAALFQTHAHEPIGAEEFFVYDVSADGQRFIINVEIRQKNPPPMDIILNWASQLKK